MNPLVVEYRDADTEIYNQFQWAKKVTYFGKSRFMVKVCVRVCVVVGVNHTGGHYHIS